MKKKTREIIVGGIEYVWTVRPNGTIAIWKDKKIFCQGEPYGFTFIGPDQINQMIKAQVLHPDLKNIPRIVTAIEHNERQIAFFRAQADIFSRSNAELIVKIS